VKVIITGKDGQLGQALIDSVPQGVELMATGRDQLNLADAGACRQIVYEFKPDWVISAGAYTAVDRAESEPDLAMAVNASAPGAFAEALAETGGKLLQVSTDFVFNGAQGHPYEPAQAMQPLGVYGKTKAAGESAAQAALTPEQLTILRTSWVYGPVGKNFCLTMLRLHRQNAETGEPLGVVADQVGCPTSTLTLASACWAATAKQGGGVLHWCDAGAASWYDFAIAIGELGVSAGLLHKAAQVKPLTTADYPTPAERPSYTLLDCTSSRQALNLQATHWREALAAVLGAVSTPKS